MGRPKRGTIQKFEQINQILLKSRKPLRAAELSDITDINLNTVRGSLVKLKNKGLVQAVQRGLYKSSGDKKLKKNKRTKRE
jgi:predicted ArsR family transcriptional regulator